MNTFIFQKQHSSIHKSDYFSDSNISDWEVFTPVCFDCPLQQSTINHVIDFFDIQ